MLTGYRRLLAVLDEYANGRVGLEVVRRECLSLPALGERMRNPVLQLVRDSVVGGSETSGLHVEPHDAQQYVHWLRYGFGVAVDRPWDPDAIVECGFQEFEERAGVRAVKLLVDGVGWKLQWCFMIPSSGTSCVAIGSEVNYRPSSVDLFVDGNDDAATIAAVEYLGASGVVRRPVGGW